jgi:hypothetical protein
MMQASSIDIKDMLEAYEEESSSGSSLGLVFKTNLFIGKEPALPKNSVTIFDTPGFPPYLGLSDVGYEYPSVQIRVRNTNYQDGWELIERIKNALHGRNHEIWNATLYTVIYCSSGPTPLEWDDNGNIMFVVNFNLQRRVA